MDDKPDISQDLIDQFVGAAHGDFDAVVRLLDEHPNLIEAQSSWQETAIEAAAQTGNVQITEYLLERGAKLDICTAAMLGKSDMVKALLDRDPELVEAVGAHGIPVLYFPVITGQEQTAEVLFDAGADLNAGDGSLTPLHGAVVFDNPAMVEWLLEKGARVDVVDHEGHTPLQIAVANDRTTLVEMLRQKEEEQDSEDF